MKLTFYTFELNVQLKESLPPTHIRAPLPPYTSAPNYSAYAYPSNLLGLYFLEKCAFWPKKIFFRKKNMVPLLNKVFFRVKGDLYCWNNPCSEEQDLFPQPRKMSERRNSIACKRRSRGSAHAAGSLSSGLLFLLKDMLARWLLHIT